MATMIRVNAQFLLIWRLRNRKELDALTEELSALYSPEEITRMYHFATEEQYSFLYVNLMAPKSQMFHLRFEQRIVPEE